MILALLFDSAGAGEWLLLLAVMLIVMGPKRLPATARKVGAYYSKFRRAADSFKRQLMDMDYEMEREFRKVEEEAQAALDDPEASHQVTDSTSDESGSTNEETEGSNDGDYTH